MAVCRSRTASSLQDARHCCKRPEQIPRQDSDLHTREMPCSRVCLVATVAPARSPTPMFLSGMGKYEILAAPERRSCGPFTPYPAEDPRASKNSSPITTATLLRLTAYCGAARNGTGLRRRWLAGNLQQRPGSARQLGLQDGCGWAQLGVQQGRRAHRETCGTGTSRNDPASAQRCYCNRGRNSARAQRTNAGTARRAANQQAKTSRICCAGTPASTNNTASRTATGSGSDAAKASACRHPGRA